MLSNRTSTITDANGTTVTWMPTNVLRAPEHNSYVNWSSGDTCACLNGSQRSCASCLDSLLGNGETCIVTPMGLCTSASNAESLDFFNRLNVSYYSSSNASYCSSNDTLCSTCRARWVETHLRGGLLELGAVCLGDGDCICTPLCELRALGVITSNGTSFSTGMERCSAFDMSQSKFENFVNFKQMGNIAFLLGGAMLVVLFVRYTAVQFDQRRSDQRILARRQARREQREAAATRSGLTVTLSGWNSYREQLIEHEQQQLGLKGDAISLSQAAQASSPVRVVVEEGEGFRPASPSQLARRHTGAE